MSKGVTVRIDPGNSNIPPASGRRTGRLQRSGFSAPSTEESSETSSAEISVLMGDLDEIPEVRAELVEEVRQRLSRGELLTRDAAEKTAEAILADLADFLGQ